MQNIVVSGHILCRSRALIAARERKKKLKRIHQRQDNRPAAPLPPTWRNARPNTLQGLQEYQSLVENPPRSSPEIPASTIQTNQSSDTTYAYPYQHMLDRFIAFMTMYQRRRASSRSARPSSMQPETLSAAPSSGDMSNGYLEPLSVLHGCEQTSESQTSGSDCRYEVMNEAPLLANRLSNI